MKYKINFGEEGKKNSLFTALFIFITSTTLLIFGLLEMIRFTFVVMIFLWMILAMIPMAIRDFSVDIKKEGLE